MTCCARTVAKPKNPKSPNEAEMGVPASWERQPRRLAQLSARWSPKPAWRGVLNRHLARMIDDKCQKTAQRKLPRKLKDLEKAGTIHGHSSGLTTSRIEIPKHGVSGKCG